MADKSGENISQNANATPDDSSIKWQSKEGEPSGEYGNDPYVRMRNAGANQTPFGSGKGGKG